MAEIKVAGVNASTVLTDAQLQAVVPALQMQPPPSILSSGVTMVLRVIRISINGRLSCLPFPTVPVSPPPGDGA